MKLLILSLFSAAVFAAANIPRLEALASQYCMGDLKMGYVSVSEGLQMYH